MDGWTERIIQTMNDKIERLDARVKELEARLDRIADAARPRALSLECEACGGRGTVTIHSLRQGGFAEPCMACKGLGRRV